MGAAPTLILFDADDPGPIRCADAPPEGVTALRDVLGRLLRRASVTALPPDRRPATSEGRCPAQTRDRPSVLSEGGRRRRLALAWTGGWAWQASRVAPLLEALALPAHLFVPVERLGCAHALRIEDLAVLARVRDLHLELDLSMRLPAGSRDLDRWLACACRTLAFHTGRAPRHAYLGRAPCGRREGFLLSQHGIEGAVTRSVPGARRNPYVSVQPAMVAPGPLRWRIEAFCDEAMIRGRKAGAGVRRRKVRS